MEHCRHCTCRHCKTTILLLLELAPLRYNLDKPSIHGENKLQRRTGYVYYTAVLADVGGKGGGGVIIPTPAKKPSFILYILVLFRCIGMENAPITLQKNNSWCAAKRDFKKKSGMRNLTYFLYLKMGGGEGGGQIVLATPATSLLVAHIWFLRDVWIRTQRAASLATISTSKEMAS
jgi:hypothetical protein